MPNPDMSLVALLLSKKPVLLSISPGGCIVIAFCVRSSRLRPLVLEQLELWLFSKSRVMASLEAAFAAKSSELAKNSKGSMKTRVVADPSIGVDSIAKVLREYMVHHNCRDLWSLVCPPPGGPLTLTWSTPVCGPWLLKVVGLLYDLLVLAPNSKLLAVKVRGALESLHRTNDLTIPAQKGRTDSDQFDKLDLTIRLLMNHIRQVKQDDKLKSRLWRLLARAEQLKLELCLEKVDLHLSFDPESKSEGAGEVNLLQLVPWKPPSEVEETPPVAPPQVVPPLPPPLPPPVSPPRTVSFRRDSLFRLPPVVQKILGRSGQQGAKAELQKSKKGKKGKKGKKPLVKKAIAKPVAPPKPKTIKDPAASKGKKKDEKASVPKPKVSPTIADCELIANAMVYAPAAAEKTKPKPKKPAKKPATSTSPAEKKIVVPKQNPKKPKKSAQKPATSTSPAEKKIVVPKQNPKKPKKSTQKPATSTSIPAEEQIVVPKQDPKEPKKKNMIFEALEWGTCRLECYAEKSYIRHKDSDLKWRSVVSCCARGLHQQIIKDMVEQVKKGLSSGELFQIRDDLLAKLQASS